MAHQAILAAAERRRQAAAEASGFLRKKKTSPFAKQKHDLRTALALQVDRLDELFPIWDVDGDGTISKTEFTRALRLLGVSTTAAQVDAFCSLCDEDGSGDLDLNEIKQLLAATDMPKPDPPPPKPLYVRALTLTLDFLNTTAVQSVLYFAVVIIFQLLVDTLRDRTEVLLDERFHDTFLRNRFDHHLNNFEMIRRQADVYEWGNQVLFPGLFGESGPSCGSVGPAGHFASWSVHPSSAAYSAATGSADAGSGSALPGFKGGCNDDGWPDGDGPFGEQGRRSWTVEELTDLSNQLDWGDGILIRQVRTQTLPPSHCGGAPIYGGDRCRPELDPPYATESREPYGFNFTSATGDPLEQPFKWMSAAEMGTDPQGEYSAHIGSLKPIAPGGYAAVIIPFFSTVWLPEERGLAHQVIDFRRHRATRSNGKTAKFACVRLSWNGEIVHQLCDPNTVVDGVERTTGVVRAAVEELWNDLKRAHYLDTASRALVITMQLNSNNLGVRARVALMFEFTPAGGVLASYDTVTRVVQSAKLQRTASMLWIAFAFTSFFCSLELIEVLQGGIGSYFGNMWNVMDWANYSIFYVFFMATRQYLSLAGTAPCESQLCESVGFYDDYATMERLRSAKLYLAMCVCIQLLKMAKFTSALIPKMGLAPLVLKRALPDMVFFGFVFVVSMLSFSTLFYVQLGPVMMEYSTQTSAFISLARALFGDFDIDAILSNSSGYINAIYFIAYLFVAVFILLSMFFAILGESQANVRDDQRDARKAAKQDGTSLAPEYGIITHAYQWAQGSLSRVPIVGAAIQSMLATKTAVEFKTAVEESGPTAVDRMEARQLEMLDGLQELFGGVHRGLETVANRCDELRGAMPASHGGASESAVNVAAEDDRQSAALIAEAESKALSMCSEADVPILRLLRSPCPDGMHGYACDERWGLDDKFLPSPAKWRAEWNASARAVTNCQRGFFDAVADHMTRVHWEVEWDAQPFRISAVPPRTIGKMIHQIVTANYYHLTLTPERRPPLRRTALPGWSYAGTTQPGFRWNVMDYGAGNVFSDPLSAGSRCAGHRRAWHCIWQRFPQQHQPRTPPPPSSVLANAASALYNLSMTGRYERSMLQYLVVAGVTQVFAEPTTTTREYLRSHLKVLCHVPGPHCGGRPDELATPVVAVHVRRGDSCDRERDEPGPFNSMFAWDKAKGRLDRVGFRYCYTWRVYLEQLKLLQRLYGVRTVLLATDDADGRVVGRLPREKGFNWAFMDYPRSQFKKRGWMEFRKDLTEDVPFSLAAALELLGSADMLVGNMGSHVTRMIYNKMVASTATSQLPPFLSVDGYGLCCDFTEDCSKHDIRRRNRDVRECIHKYGQCTGGDQFFRWGG